MGEMGDTLQSGWKEGCSDWVLENGKVEYE
jgi:hypothetical protein